MNIGHNRVFCWMSDHEEQERLFVRGAFQNAIQKGHRTRRVGERDKSGVVNCRDEKSGRDAH